ncbi:MAG: hypothetical protein R3B49_01435 [Phycisphaerales bacterium]
MTCSGNNATPPSPAIAPGAESIDPRRVAEALAARHGPGGADPRLAALVPGFDAPFFQAGLAGYSEAAMRLIARRHGCPLCVTEALLDRTLLAGGRGFAKADLGEIAGNVPGGDEDHPLVGQIMGSDPAEMAAAALKMIEQGRRGDRAYRHAAYKGDQPDWFREKLRLPGGEQLAPGTGDQAMGNRQWAMGQEPESDPLPIAHSPLPSPRTFAAHRRQPRLPGQEDRQEGPRRALARRARRAPSPSSAVRDAVPADIPVTVDGCSFDDTEEMARARASSTPPTTWVPGHRPRAQLPSRSTSAPADGNPSASSFAAAPTHPSSGRATCGPSTTSSA